MSNHIPESSNEVIETLLIERLELTADHTDADVLSFMGPIFFTVDDLIRNGVESIKDKKRALFFFLETPGGYVEPVQRIADTLRHYYEEVNFVIPSFALGVSSGPHGLDSGLGDGSALSC